jgi:CelD/BcsL family acetyltransferase involved in cellulose biosynthesis
MSGHRITVARTLGEVESLREAWSALPVESPTADLDYHLTMIAHTPEVVRPHVVLLERDGAPLGLAVGRLERARLTAKLGYATVLQPRVLSLTVSQGGLVDADGEHAEPLLAALVAALRDEADVLQLRFVPVGSAAHTLATTAPGALRRQRFSEPVHRWRAALPPTFAEYLQARSAKTRSNVKRYARRLEEQFGDRLTLRVFVASEELDELVRDTETVSVKTYQHGLGAGFSDAARDRALLELALARGWYRGFVLSLDGVPSAYWHGMVYGRTFFTGPTGYDPEHRDLRLGTYVLGKMVERVCGEADRLDFGVGDAEYKRHFGDEHVAEEDVLVFAPRAKPVAVNLARSSVLGVSRAGRAVLARSGAFDEARRRWRSRLSGGG